MELKELINASHQTAKQKGFWDKERNVGELLMLIVSEAGEALEAHRSGKEARPENLSHYSGSTSTSLFKQEFEEHVKSSFEDELADMCIRIFDLAGGLGINLEYHILLKMKYNDTRERLHGKKY